MSHISAFPCDHIGSQTGGIEISFSFRRMRFVARKQILSVFGAEVEGQLEGSGFTKKRALRNLHREEELFHESLWI
jgi:hypothetical protein